MIEQTSTANPHESDLIGLDEATALGSLDRAVLRTLINTGVVKGVGRGKSARISKSGLLAYARAYPVAEQLRLF